MESRPVFADPSGRRHRVLRFAGLTAAALLAICLGAVAMAMTGGPQAPFTQWAAPQPTHDHAFPESTRRAAGHDRTSGPARGVPVASPGAGPTMAANPSPSAAASPSAHASAAPTNRVGKAPPGHTKSPSPHKPTSVA